MKAGLFQKLCFCIFSVALMAPGFGYAADERPSVKKVECTVEIMPNYIWHLLALGDVWDKTVSPYAKERGSSVPKADTDFIHEKRNLIVWGNGSSSLFTSFLFFIPFASEMTDQQYFAYLDELNQAAKTGKWTVFFQKYCPQYLSMAGQIDPSPEHVATFGRLTEIIKNNYPAYKSKIWPEVSKILELEKRKIDSAFSGTNVIEKWENSLKVKYAGDAFYPVLTYANGVDGLPSANDLSPVRDNFGVSGANFQDCVDLITHEVGIFTLSPLRAKLQSDAALQTEFIKSRGVLYQAVESYVERKKGQIFGNSKVWEGNLQSGGSFNFSFFFRYYSAKENELPTEQLIRGAVDAYVKDATSSSVK